jgi:hypothetical protein
VSGRRARRAWIAALLAAGGAGCGEGGNGGAGADRAGAGAASPWFTEVAVASGLDFRHESGFAGPYLMPEIMAGGVGLLDYDGDGDLDVYCVQAGALDPAPGVTPPGNRLYRNRGDGTFEDVTGPAGVGDRGYGMGCACADYDGDGDVDLYVTNVGPNVLYRNEGDGTFTDVTSAAGTGDDGWGTSAAFLDHDDDGHLDLFVTNYIRWSIDNEIGCQTRGGLPDYCTPKSYQAPAPDTLYRNRGDGTFEDVTEAAGLLDAFGNGLGVTWGDFDGTGGPDLYVANDGVPNQLWINQGGGRFRDEAMLRGCAVNGEGMAEAGMGVAAVDLAVDGWPDLFLSHLSGESNTLYVNRGGMFEDRSALEGLGAPSRPRTGFGLGFADLDHDGNLDVFVANGRVTIGAVDLDPDDPYAEPNLLYRGTADGRFEPVAPDGGTAPVLVATSRAAAFGDLDGDGDIDAVVINRDGPAHLLRNERGGDGAWIMFRVLDQDGRTALGAVVTVDDDAPQTRRVETAYSYCASNDSRVHFGLGTRSDARPVRVTWPDGAVERFGPLDPGAVHELRRGRGTRDGDG